MFELKVSKLDFLEAYKKLGYDLSPLTEQTFLKALFEDLQKANFVLLKKEGLKDVSATLKQGQCSLCTRKRMDYCRFDTIVCGAQSIAAFIDELLESSK